MQIFALFRIQTKTLKVDVEIIADNIANTFEGNEIRAVCRNWAPNITHIIRLKFHFGYGEIFEVFLRIVSLVCSVSMAQWQITVTLILNVRLRKFVSKYRLKGGGTERKLFGWNKSRA